MEFIHAPPLFVCLVSFLSHFGESWNLQYMLPGRSWYKLTTTSVLCKLFFNETHIDIQFFLDYTAAVQK